MRNQKIQWPKVQSSAKVLRYPNHSLNLKLDMFWPQCKYHKQFENHPYAKFRNKFKIIAKYFLFTFRFSLNPLRILGEKISVNFPNEFVLLDNIIAIYPTVHKMISDHKKRPNIVLPVIKTKFFNLWKKPRDFDFVEFWNKFFVTVSHHWNTHWDKKSTFCP